MMRKRTKRAHSGGRGGRQNGCGAPEGAAGEDQDVGCMRELGGEGPGRVRTGSGQLLETKRTDTNMLLLEHKEEKQG